MTNIMTDFKLIQLDSTDSENLFTDLENSTIFEPITKGRTGANIMKMTTIINETKISVPIVRTTTKYQIPNQQFNDLHHMIIKKIQLAINSISTNTNNSISANFNNALIEIYDNSYTTMGFHSDQSLDLQNNSYIAIFSCYNIDNKIDNIDNIQPHNIRKLIIKKKDSLRQDKDSLRQDKNSLRQEVDTEEILLKHNSVLLFSTETNKKYLHKIVLDLDKTIKPSDTAIKWLGITFRVSKTNIIFNCCKLPLSLPLFNAKGEEATDTEKADTEKAGEEAGEEVKKTTLLIQPYPIFAQIEQTDQIEQIDQTEQIEQIKLTMASPNELKEFYKMRGLENKLIDFTYPSTISYTISEGDLMIL